MTKFERAAQLWPLLAFAARKQSVLSYKMVEQLTGLPKQGVGEYLGPIQDYCREQNLPPLTSLVIKEDIGVPGSGFTEAQDVFAAQSRVFVFDWLAHGAPTVEDLTKAKAKTA
jgi:hypothetical protein